MNVPCAHMEHNYYDLQTKHTRNSNMYYEKRKCAGCGEIYYVRYDGSKPYDPVEISQEDYDNHANWTN